MHKDGINENLWKKNQRFRVEVLYIFTNVFDQLSYRNGDLKHTFGEGKLNAWTRKHHPLEIISIVVIISS